MIQTQTLVESERPAPDSTQRPVGQPAGFATAFGQCRSLAELFLTRVAATPNTLAYQYSASDGPYRQLTWAEAGERVRWLARGLLALGVKREECCALVCGTRIEWILADLAVLCASGATTTIYPGSSLADRRHILLDSACGFAFVENAAELEKLRPIRAELTQLRRVVLIEGTSSGDDWVISLAELEALGREYEQLRPGAFESVVRSVEPSDLATIVYTSGTTGQPKGARLAHDGWLYMADVGVNLDLWSADDHQYLWLPLSHVFGKVLELCAIRIGFPTTVDARVAQLMDNLALVRPTFMGAPPRIFEKMYTRIKLSAEQGGVVKRAVFHWACRVGRAVSAVRRAGEQPSGALRLQFALADRLVFAKVRARFGGRIRFLFSGSAALPEELAEFFHAAGLLILEGYGLTETSAGAVLNRMNAFAFGTVGMPLPGTQLALDEDGEILIKSRGVMLGYHNLPKETLAVLSPDGWLRTGDIGELDARGFLRITDRKKDLIKTSGGHYVAPQKLEGLLKAASPLIAQVVVHGEGRSHCCALIELDPDAVAQSARGKIGLGTSEAASADRLRLAIAGVNATLAAHERIHRFAFLPTPLSMESGLLTASMKVRRKTVEQRYRELLDQLYEGARPDPRVIPEWVRLPKEKAS